MSSSEEGGRVGFYVEIVRSPGSTITLADQTVGLRARVPTDHDCIPKLRKAEQSGVRVAGRWQGYRGRDDESLGLDLILNLGEVDLELLLRLEALEAVSDEMIEALRHSAALLLQFVVVDEARQLRELIAVSVPAPPDPGHQLQELLRLRRR